MMVLQQSYFESYPWQAMATTNIAGTASNGVVMVRQHKEQENEHNSKKRSF